MLIMRQSEKLKMIPVKFNQETVDLNLTGIVSSFLRCSVVSIIDPFTFITVQFAVP